MRFQLAKPSCRARAHVCTRNVVPAGFQLVFVLPNRKPRFCAHTHTYAHDIVGSIGPQCGLQLVVISSALAEPPFLAHAYERARSGRCSLNYKSKAPTKRQSPNYKSKAPTTRQNPNREIHLKRRWPKATFQETGSKPELQVQGPDKKTTPELQAQGPDYNTKPQLQIQSPDYKTKLEQGELLKKEGGRRPPSKRLV